MGTNLGASVGAAGIEGSVFVLRRGIRKAAKHFARGRLIEPHAFVFGKFAECFQQLEGPLSVRLQGIGGLFERDPDVTLCR